MHCRMAIVAQGQIVKGKACFSHDYCLSPAARGAQRAVHHVMLLRLPTWKKGRNPDETKFADFKQGANGRESRCRWFTNCFDARMHRARTSSLGSWRSTAIPTAWRRLVKNSASGSRVSRIVLLYVACDVSILVVLRVAWMKAATKIIESRSTMVGAGALSMKKDR